MTAKAKPESLAALLPNVLKRVEEHHAGLAAVRHAWSGLVGKALAKHTHPVSLRRGRLVVSAERPGDSYLLSYKRTELLEQLRRITEGRVEELIVRPGGPSKSR
jgi:hypothetical protein